MKIRKQILTGIGALAFMAVMALNVQLVQNPNGNQGLSGLTLMELAAKACCVQEDPGGDSEGTLVEGSSSGNFYCCPGSNDCSAAEIPDESWCP